jgi:hypothetical protein
MVNNSGLVPAAYGGTGLSNPSTAGNVLTSNGAGGWTSSAPASGGITAGQSIAFALIFSI